jgi:MFS family permease
LVFAAGHAADRYDRTRVEQVCQMVEGLTATLLAWASFAGHLNVREIFAAVAVLGTATAFESPAAAALLPGVAPEGMLQKGTALSAGGFQAAMICAPALGGLAYARSPGAPYTVMAVFWLLAGMLNGATRLARPGLNQPGLNQPGLNQPGLNQPGLDQPGLDQSGLDQPRSADPVTSKEPPTLAALFAGVGFVRRNPAILGTISLDLFAVLLGGATALLPIYAREILHTGPWGLGVLCSAPAGGALLMTAALARHALTRRVGMRMFQAVIVFGLATVVFAVSHLIWLSLLALFIMGAADTVSVVIRTSLVQLRTPDEMRGRVGAVNFLFINASSQLGEFESGITAALFGAMPAAVLGGVGTVAVALLWMKLFPTLRNVERLE